MRRHLSAHVLSWSGRWSVSRRRVLRSASVRIVAGQRPRAVAVAIWGLDLLAATVPVIGVPRNSTGTLAADRVCIAFRVCCRVAATAALFLGGGSLRVS